MVIATLNRDDTQESIIAVVIERENLDRMKKADPATLESSYRGGLIKPIRYPERLSLLIAYEEDDAELYRILREGDLSAFLQYLERGRKFIAGLDGTENALSVEMKNVRREGI